MNEALPLPRCASWAREQGVDPGGTAPRFDTLVLVEHPLPWPRDVADDSELARLAQIATKAAGPGRTVRFQVAAAAPERRERRVVVFDRGPGPFAGYGRAEGSAPANGLAHLVADLVSSSVAPPSSLNVTDVLICTHGTRDRCCGSMGTRLWMAAQQRVLGVRVWRTSHTGGHRFAPTAITFPDGCCWAHLDDEVLAALLDRTLPAELAVQHLRGCSAFEPALQVADGAALAARGWPWLSCARVGSESSPSRVELSFEEPIGLRGAYDVVLERGRELPVPDCGADPKASAKSQAELKVSSLHLTLWDAANE